VIYKKKNSKKNTAQNHALSSLPDFSSYIRSSSFVVSFQDLQSHLPVPLRLLLPPVSGRLFAVLFPQKCSPTVSWYQVYIVRNIVILWPPKKSGTPSAQKRQCEIPEQSPSIHESLPLTWTILKDPVRTAQ